MKLWDEVCAFKVYYRFDFIGKRYAGECHGVEIVCSLGLPDALDILIRGSEVTDYLAFD